MITIPPSKPEKWHKRFEWVKYANTLFRYYSRRGNYALRLETGKGYIASVTPKTRIVRLNPDFVTAPLQHVRAVRHSPQRMRDHIIASMKGYLAHEAAHVRFSSEKPAGLLGQIWNSIEDERIERLMSQAHPDLAAIFTHIGDIHLTRSWDALRFDPLEGVLAWRWAHDHPTLRWQCNDPETWARVQPHVEAAWIESDPNKVEEHARAILEALGLPEQAQAPELMNGPLVTCPDPEPGKGKTGKGGKGKDKKDRQKQDDGDKASGSGGQGDEQADDDNQAGSGKGRDQSQDDAGDSQGASGGAGDQNDAKDGSQGDGQSDQDGEDEQGTDGDQGAGDDSDDATENADGKDESEGDDTEDGDDAGDDDQGDAADEGDDQDEGDADSDDDADVDHDDEDDEDDEDEDRDGDPFGSHDDDAGNDGAAGGEGVAYPGYEPTPPEVVPEEPDHVRAREILRDVEGHSRDLAAALALPDAPNLRVSHESRGRFDYGRYATGAQRQFRYKHHKGKKELPRITLLHDNSGSMGNHQPNNAQYHAVRATMMLQRACELSRTPLNVIAFNSRHSLVTTHLDDPETARGNIGGIRSTGGTNLAPALRNALALKHPSRKRHVIAIYCDGQIDKNDAIHCQRLAKEHPDTFILPILIGPSTRREQFDLAFGRSLQVSSADELATNLKTWVSANLHT